jgi:4-amino-4-deoxy-L-arabinose transferase-like glycosyltransferase
LAWLALWATTLGVPFLSDDYVILARHGATGGAAAEQFFRPVFGAVFDGLAWIGGQRTWPFRIAAAVLHLTSALMVRRLVTRLFGSATAGAIACASFLLSPLQLEVTVWIAGLQDALWTAFALAALTLYARGSRPGHWQILGTAALMGLALGSKESAVALVLLLPAIDLARRRFEVTSHGLAYVAFAVTTAAYLGLRSRHVALEPGWLAPMTRYFVKQFVALPYQLFMQPWSTAAVDMPRAIAFVTAAAGIIAVFWTLAVRRTWFGPIAGATVILASTLPLNAYFFVRDDLAAARYLYFPAIGWAVIIATVLPAVFASRRALATGVIAMATGWVILVGINLAPWWRASAIVREMETAGARGDDPAATAARWAEAHRVTVLFRDGIPREHAGVGLFINGYPEFLARIRETP